MHVKINIYFRDNVVWDEEQEQEARAKIEEQMKHPASSEDQGVVMFSLYVNSSIKWPICETQESAAL